MIFHFLFYLLWGNWLFINLVATKFIMSKYCVINPITALISWKASWYFLISSLNHQRLQLFNGWKIGTKILLVVEAKAQNKFLQKTGNYRMIITDTCNTWSKKLILSLFLFEIRKCLVTQLSLSFQYKRKSVI